jgi:hypothetical protein
MGLLESNAGRQRFDPWVDDHTSVIGHANRIVPLHAYCTSRPLPSKRKSFKMKVIPQQQAGVAMKARAWA